MYTLWQQPVKLLPDTSADMAQPATGQADTLQASAEAGRGNSNVIKNPSSLIESHLTAWTRGRLLPGKCPVLMAQGPPKA